MKERHYSPVDRLLIHVDVAVRTVLGSTTAGRPNPAAGLVEPVLEDEDRKESARLMRVNHAGEVAAQALYEGQALTARGSKTRAELEKAAAEERDHLAWCSERVHQLGGRLSLLNPFWYGGSLAIGALAGLAGDRWNLGFLAETERQVVTHLEGHLQRLPTEDQKSREIVKQMREDEARHAATATRSGGLPLPGPVNRLMRLASRLMTRTAYWL